jgi:PiT family inorganic phosphate transporter
MMLALLVVAVVFLSYSNGANDNFKGVASLYGSRTCGYRAALGWATVTTLAGSLCGLVLASGLLKRFSGKGLVPDTLIASPAFLLAVALGAAGTVFLATRLGFPISTTHALTGAILGAGLAAPGHAVNFAALGKNFVLPLLLSPLLAVLLGGLLYLILRAGRLFCGVQKEWCICAGTGMRIEPVPQPGSVFAAQAVPAFTIATGDAESCSERYAGAFLGLSAQRLMDAAHFLSAGVVSFARGLNDTPKIAALLLLVTWLQVQWGLATVGAAIALGGLLNARKVAETMSRKITAMNTGQGFAANLSTGLLVLAASRYGLPVSTTHVSVGSLFGMGLVTRQAHLKTVAGIALSWVITLPCAAALGALVMALAPR